MTSLSKLAVVAIAIGFLGSKAAPSSAATFTIDSSQSYLRASISIPIGSSDPQFPQSDLAALAGSFQVNLNGGVISFPEGISVTLLNLSTPVEPLPGGLPGSAAANVGLVNLIPGLAVGVVAIRDSVFTLSATDGIVVGNGFSSAIDAAFTSGTVDVNYNLSVGPNPNIYGSAHFDSTIYPAANGGIVEIVGTLVRLSIPVDFEYDLLGFPELINILPLHFQGEIVATGLIPEPSSLALTIVGGAACVGVTLRRRK